MKIFISWSGERSKRLAEILRNWLPLVIQRIQPYYSDSDIEKGARWGTKIASELEASEYGLICLTPENREAPWIMFEAGALSKNIGISRVCPILFGLSPLDIQGPLVQFQAARYTKPDVKALLRSLNSCMSESALPSAVLDVAFEKWWPDLESQIASVLAETNTDAEGSKRTEKDLIEEVLTITRELAKRNLRTDTYIDHPITVSLISRYTYLVKEIDKLGFRDSLFGALRFMLEPIEFLVYRIPQPLFSKLNPAIGELIRAKEALGESREPVYIPPDQKEWIDQMSKDEREKLAQSGE